MVGRPDRRSVIFILFSRLRDCWSKMMAATNNFPTRPVPLDRNTFPPSKFLRSKYIFLFFKTKAFVMPVVMFSLLLLIVPRAKRRDKFWGTGGRGLLWRGRNLIHHHHFFFVSARPRAGKKEEARELTWQLFRHRLLHRTPSS